MQEIIITGDDEDDLCSKKKISKKHFVLTSLVAVAFMTVIAQQFQSVFRLESPVAVAASPQKNNICDLKEDFAQYFYENNAKISFVVDSECNKGESMPLLLAPANDEGLEQEIVSIVSGYPIVDMASAIAQQDRTIAAFLVGIAKKESDWGKHSPTKNGSDCYNYWGYKGNGKNGNAGGYACFASREEAVQTVGARLSTLSQTQHRDTPAKMLVWKCGNSCAGHTPEGVASWIGSVEKYVSALR